MLANDAFGSTQLLTVDARTGALTRQRFQHCADDPANYNALSHELRVDVDRGDQAAGAAPLGLLTTRYVARKFDDGTGLGGVAVPTFATRLNASSYVAARFDEFVGSTVDRWDYLGDADASAAAGAGGRVAHDANASSPLATVYDLFDFVDPVDNPVATSTWTTVSLACDVDADDVVDDNGDVALDWTHVSAVSVGTAGNYLVSLRNLDAVLSLHRNGSGRAWTLSSTDAIASDFAFERDEAKFYQPHSVAQLPDGDVILIDSGDDRAGCEADDGAYARCFTRAVRYRLDARGGTAKLVWQFAYPFELSNRTVDAAGRASLKAALSRDAFNFDGGTVELLADGRYLVGFTNTVEGQRAWNPHGDMLLFEVDDAARVRAMMTVPRPTQTGGVRNGGYRTLPWESIGGESSQSPLSR